MDGISRNALLISFSAFFADFGYQSVVAALPILMVIILHAPPYVFGITVAVSSGFGAVLAYYGGVLSDIFGRKKITILGNILIPILSLSGIAANFYEAAALFSGGWLSRNFRSPSRRALLNDEVNESNRGKVFGLLNALDVGGGAFSIILLISLSLLGVPLRYIILLTAIPILFSTVLLLLVKEKKRKASSPKPQMKKERMARVRGSMAYKGVIIATALYGFSFYSLGFPILTIAQYSSNNVLGYLSYLIFLVGSALFGYFIGSRKIRLIKGLGVLGYLMSAIATAAIGIAYALHLGIYVMYAAVLFMGMAIGTIDTLEPSLVSIVKSGSKIGRGMGSLTASRSVGIFIGNIAMGLLYGISPAFSYAYAAIVSVVAASVILVSGKGIWERRA